MIACILVVFFALQEAPAGDGFKPVGVFAPGEIPEDPYTALRHVTGEETPAVPRLLPAIRRRDVELYGEWAGFSPEQWVFVWGMFEDYCKSYRQSLAQRGPSIIALARASTELQIRHTALSLEYVSVARDFIRESMACNIETGQAATTFFDRVKSVLKEPQLVAFQRAERDAARRRTTVHGRGHWPSCADPIAILETMQLNGPPMAVLDPILIEYEREITPLVVRLERILESRQIPLAEAYGRLNLNDDGTPIDASKPGARETYERNDQRIRAILREGADLQDEIHTINKRYVSQIVAALPPDRAPYFLEQYRNKAYPPIWPDPCDPAPLFEVIVAHNAVTADVRETLIQAWAAYKPKHAEIQSRMETDFEIHKHRFAATESESHDEPFYGQLKRGKDKRMKLQQAFWQTVRGLLPPAALAGFKNHLRHAEDTLQAERDKNALARE